MLGALGSGRRIGFLWVLATDHLRLPLWKVLSYLLLLEKSSLVTVALSLPIRPYTPFVFFPH